jgi:hypothetical protein
VDGVVMLMMFINVLTLPLLIVAASMHDSWWS